MPCASHAQGSSLSAAMARAMSAFAAPTRALSSSQPWKARHTTIQALMPERLGVVGIAGDRPVEQRERVAAALV